MEIVFASNNSHKIEELRQMVGDRIKILSLADINCSDDIPETADSFEGNALLKAQWIKNKYGYDCFADDSGLEVKALGGAPGIFSARYSGAAENVSYHNNLKLLKEMEGVTDRAARFRTAIVLLIGNNQPVVFNGIVNGSILTQPQGNEGFGYDPLFVPDGWNCSFAQATPQQKNEISHRGQAVRKLVQYLSNFSI